MNDRTFYGVEAQERLDSSVEDAVQRAVWDAGDDPDSVDWPLRICVFRPMETPDAEFIAGWSLDDVMDRLDEELGDPDGGPTKPTPAMEAAALELAKVIKAEYVSWACKPTGEVIECTREQWGQDGGSHA